MEAFEPLGLIKCSYSTAREGVWEMNHEFFFFFFLKNNLVFILEDA